MGQVPVGIQLRLGQDSTVAQLLGRVALSVDCQPGLLRLPCRDGRSRKALAELGVFPVASVDCLVRICSGAFPAPRDIGHTYKPEVTILLEVQRKETIDSEGPYVRTRISNVSTNGVDPGQSHGL